MKTKLNRDLAGISNVNIANEQVRREIQSFLRALDSYPDRVAVSPGISFEEHLFEEHIFGEHRGSLVHASEPAPRRRMLNAR